MPALALDDGSLLSEGPAIVQYLADLKPDSGLLPKVGDIARYHVIEWLTYINSEMHKTFTPLFGPASDEMKADAREKLAKRFAYVDGALAGKSYLMGETFTAADAYLFVMTSWAIFQKIAVPANVAEFPQARHGAARRARRTEGRKG